MNYVRYLAPPYLGCFHRVIERLLMAFEPHPPEDQIALFCEDNDFKGEIGKIWDYWLKKRDSQNRLVSLTFGRKTDFVPLQAADALAYEAYKALDNQRFGKGRKRKSLEIMGSTNNIHVFYFDKENLPRTVAHLEEVRASLFTK